MPGPDTRHALKRHQSRALLAAALALAFFSAPARAETTPASADNAATRLELTVMGRTPLEKPKPPEPGVDPESEMRGKTTQIAIANGVRLTADLSAQYPKCHFRVAAITVPEDRSDGNHLSPPDLVTLRVTLVGDAGCLSSGK
jgi:hypothetical protein